MTGCEWLDAFPDEYGLACSEPDVPTTVLVPCGDVAASRLAIRDAHYGSGVYILSLCEEHARQVREDVTERGARLGLSILLDIPATEPSLS